MVVGILGIVVAYSRAVFKGWAEGPGPPSADKKKKEVLCLSFPSNPKSKYRASKRK
jgi:hypothetical protein